MILNIMSNTSHRYRQYISLSIDGKYYSIKDSVLTVIQFINVENEVHSSTNNNHNFIGI